jgi:heat shock protein HtpX
MLRRFGFFFLTNILIIMMVSIVMSLLGVGGYVTSTGLNYESLAVFCLVWGMVGSTVSLFLSKFMAKKMMGVEIVTTTGPYAGLVNKVHNLSRSAGLNKMPEVGIYHSPEVNAFATGPSKNNSLVAVSTGLLQSMSDDEVEGVLAHEVAHIKNGDMVTMALLQGVINAFVMFFARIAAFAVQNALNNDEEEGQGISHLAYFITVIVFEMIFGLFGSMVVAYFSRAREFRADAGGAKLAGQGKMIAALERLKGSLDRVDTSQKTMMSMKISSGKGMMALLKSHPDLDVRINALKKKVF